MNRPALSNLSEAHDLIVRPRRLRISSAMRDLVRETTLDPGDLIAPLFVRTGCGLKQPIASMPGQFQWSPDLVVDEVRELADLGIRAVLLFGIPETKDADGSANYDPEAVVPRTIRALKQELPELIIVSDLCFCEYTDHGHCGVINSPHSEHYRRDLPEGYLLNDPTLSLLAKAATVHAAAGADVIAPSGMVDGMVGTIRRRLDEAGFEHVAVLSYAVKYASAFYGPFRDAAECAPRFGDRAQYQMDPGNYREALREARLDVAQGADMLMVKPALPYLDVVRAVRDCFDLPVAAYQVSGEYSMIHAAAERGWLDLRRSALESLVAIRRAGADVVVTYFAKDAAQWLSGRSTDLTSAGGRCR